MRWRQRLVRRQPPALDGTSWSLTEVAGAAAQPGGLLAFDGGKVTGSTGCNRETELTLSETG